MALTTEDGVMRILGQPGRPRQNGYIECFYDRVRCHNHINQLNTP